MPPWPHVTCAKLQRYFDHLRGQPWLNSLGQPRCLTSSYWIPPDMTSIASAFSGRRALKTEDSERNWKCREYISKCTVNSCTQHFLGWNLISSAAPGGESCCGSRLWCQFVTMRLNVAKRWNRPIFALFISEKVRQGSQLTSQHVIYNMFYGPAFSQWMVISQIRQISCLFDRTSGPSGFQCIFE